MDALLRLAQVVLAEDRHLLSRERDKLHRQLDHTHHWWCWFRGCTSKQREFDNLNRTIRALNDALREIQKIDRQIEGCWGGGGNYEPITEQLHSIARIASLDGNTHLALLLGELARCISRAPDGQPTGS